MTLVYTLLTAAAVFFMAAYLLVAEMHWLFHEKPEERRKWLGHLALAVIMTGITLPYCIIAFARLAPDILRFTPGQWAIATGGVVIMKVLMWCRVWLAYKQTQAVQPVTT